MKKICFECPTVMLRRPIAEIIARLENYRIGLRSPKDITKGYLKLHFNKFKNIKMHSYDTIKPPFISYEWPIPINPFFIIKLFKIIKTYDIIHIWVPFYINNIILVILKKLLFPEKKLFITIDNYPGIDNQHCLGCFFDFLFKLFYKTIGKIIFSAADKIIIYGDSVKKIALKAGIQLKKINIVPTAVNTKIIEADKDVKQEFNIETDEKIVLFVGLINPRKRIDMIINIAKIMENNKIKFLIVGDGPKRKYYEKLTKANNLNNKIIFTGLRSDVYNFYHKADMLLLPSRIEGSPGVIMESMLYGVPVISSNITGVRDLIKDNFNGFLCDLNDLESFINKIKILLKNEKLRNKIIKNARETIYKKFNWDINIKKFKELYV